jgi:DNA replication protein DnaC
MPAQTNKDLAHLCRELKAPPLLASIERLAKRRATNRGPTRSFSPPVSSARSRPARLMAARVASRRLAFPTTRHSKDFDFSYQRSIRKDVVAHLGMLDFVVAKDNVIFLGPPGTGKTHLPTALGIRSCQAGHRVAFATAAQWVDRLGEAHAQGRLDDEFVRLGRTPLLIIDGVGYIPFDAEAANPFFQLVSSRYERASVIVTSNKPFERWGRVFGDATVAAAMIDRLVHHAEVVSLKGDSYRLKDRYLGRVPNDDAA